MNLEQFELSQAYLMFWDKLEKANYFLESIVETRDEPLDGRLVMWRCWTASPSRCRPGTPWGRWPGPPEAGGVAADQTTE
jgi:hypothetical protein